VGLLTAVTTVGGPPDTVRARTEMADRRFRTKGATTRLFDDGVLTLR
jgi:hypothetical protein